MARSETAAGGFQIVPDYVTDSSLWADMWPTVALAVIVAVGVSRALTRDKSTRNHLLLVLLAMSLLGGVTGQVTALSRTPAIGAVIPAVLALIGALAVYLVGNAGRLQQAIVAACIICLSLNLLVGVFWGSRIRTEAENRYIFERADIEEAVRHLIAIQKLENDMALEQIKADVEEIVESNRGAD